MHLMCTELATLLANQQLCDRWCASVALSDIPLRVKVVRAVLPRSRSVT